MSNHLERNIDLNQLQIKQDTAVCTLKTLSFLLDVAADDLKSHTLFDPAEFAYGIAGLLALLASDLHTNACDTSELVDQLRHEGVRP